MARWDERVPDDGDIEMLELGDENNADAVERPDSDRRCNNCLAWLKPENYGRTEDEKYWIGKCDQCGHTRIRLTGHGMLSEVIDEGENPEEVFKRVFPDSFVEQMDLSELEDMQRLVEDAQNDGATVILESDEEGKDVTDLIRPEGK